MRQVLVGWVVAVVVVGVGVCVVQVVVGVGLGKLGRWCKTSRRTTAMQLFRYGRV